MNLCFFAKHFVIQTSNARKDLECIKGWTQEKSILVDVSKYATTSFKARITRINTVFCACLHKFIRDELLSKAKKSVKSV